MEVIQEAFRCASKSYTASDYVSTITSNLGSQSDEMQRIDKDVLRSMWLRYVILHYLHIVKQGRRN